MVGLDLAGFLEFCNVQRNRDSHEQQSAWNWEFCIMKQLRVLPLPPAWDATPSQATPQHSIHLSSWVEVEIAEVRFPTHGHSTMAQARIGTQTPACQPLGQDAPHWH